VDKLRGTDDIHTRRERMRKLDIKIKEVNQLFRSRLESS
jgi:sorting nexin-4